MTSPVQGDKPDKSEGGVSEQGVDKSHTDDASLALTGETQDLDEPPSTAQLEAEVPTGIVDDDDEEVITSASPDLSTSHRAPERTRRDPSQDPTLLGRYKIQDVLGRGAFSIVYKATQVGIGRTVALKVFLLPPATRQSSQAAEAALVRFQREARLAAGLRHPHTVTLFDYDKTDRGILYMAFEHVEGPTLNQALKGDRAPMALERAIRITKQVAHSLQEAHEQGIIHRDLKPGNIMLTQRQGQHDYVKVLDFGIAKLIGSTDTERPPDYDGQRTGAMEVIKLTEPQPVTGEDLTITGRIVGTPRYIPPEQIHGETLGPSADIYSLGLILYEMIAGAPANPGQNASELLTWHLKDQPFQVPQGFQGPGGLMHIIQTATRKEASERYQSCQALLDDLERLDEQGEWRKNRPRPPLVTMAIAANVLLLLALLALGAWMVQDNSPTNVAPTRLTLGDPGQDQGAPQRRDVNAATPDAAPDTAPLAGRSPAAAPQGDTVTPTQGATPELNPPATTRRIEIGSKPKGVEVYIGDLKLGVTPLPMTLEADQRELTVTLKKRGFWPQDVTWRADADESPFPVKMRRRANKAQQKYHILP